VLKEESLNERERDRAKKLTAKIGKNRRHSRNKIH
jgi:hypothetical protein